ncbi:hypothetical protein AJGP001_14035 [Planococcus faecalis]|uniref:Uncharacterized protein n=1 Tax=Planococcus faecalis TaxID=1598147 RepID=A0ABN4XQM5_9BACL|nr:hypothetical protein AJGP001_14035 [Planococcus faecalis]OHX55055.1 hypothetical protein BB777_04850 [Planococcus faecalis]
MSNDMCSIFFARNERNTHGTREIRTEREKYARNERNTHGTREIRTEREKYVRNERNTHGAREIRTAREKYARNERKTQVSTKNAHNKNPAYLIEKHKLKNFLFQKDRQSISV